MPSGRNGYVGNMTASDFEKLFELIGKGAADEEYDPVKEAEKRLSRIFIRVDGKNISLKDATDEQFGNWYGNYLLRHLKNDMHCDHVDTCVRANMIEFLDKNDYTPVEVKE